MEALKSTDKSRMSRIKTVDLIYAANRLGTYQTAEKTNYCIKTNPITFSN